MAKTDPKLYRKYLVDEKGKKVLYLCLQKVLYGMMKSALFFTKNWHQSSDLWASSSTKIVNGNQLALRWHVDNLMISHVDVTAINEFLWELKAIYGNSLAESLGNQRDYLGMVLDFSSKNEVQINMTQYFSKIIKDFLEEIVGKSSTPAGDHLFKIREDGQNLMMRWQMRFITLCISYSLQQIVGIKIFKQLCLSLLQGCKHWTKTIGDS